MGVVFRAKDVRLGRHVALKFATNDSVTNETLHECILREARAGSAVNHPNVCSVYEVGEFQGLPFLVMESLEGRTLKERIKEPLTLESFLYLAIQICDGLDAVHSKGIVHRDIKPSNIFITTGDRVKIFDFSLAISVATGRYSRRHDEAQRGLCSILGTPVYMSPEHSHGEPLDSRTDLFSLGVVFHEMLAGAWDVPASLTHVIEKALERDRELRFQHAAEMRADLKRIQRDVSWGRLQPAPGLSPA